MIVSGMSGADVGDVRVARVGICGSGGLCCAGDVRAPNLGWGKRSLASRVPRTSRWGVLGNALRRRGVPSMAPMLLSWVSSHAAGAALVRVVRSAI